MNHIELLKEFGVSEPLSDEIIAANTAPLFDLDDDVFLIIPSYMAWCLKHDHSDGNIVIDGTISALSELGRVKEPSNSYSRFKFECTEHQRILIVEFLEWCLKIEPLMHEHTERAIKQWR